MINMPGELKISLVASFVESDSVSDLKKKVEDFVAQNQEFKIEKIEYNEYARRPTEEMMVTVLLDIAKKLDELKLAQEMSE